MFTVTFHRRCTHSIRKPNHISPERLMLGSNQERNSPSADHLTGGPADRACRHRSGVTQTNDEVTEQPVGNAPVVLDQLDGGRVCDEVADHVMPVP